jgi:hypothetical protein
MYCSSLSTETFDSATKHWYWTERMRKTFIARSYDNAIPTNPAIK